MPENHLYTWYGENKGPGKMSCTCGAGTNYANKDEAIKAHAAHRSEQQKAALA